MVYGSVASTVEELTCFPALVSSVFTKPDRFLFFLGELRPLQNLRIIQVRRKHERTLSE